MTPRFAVIFDMDGVLIDSYAPHFESWKRLAGECGCEYSEQDFVRGFGRTSPEVIAEQWSDGSELTDDRIRELANRKEAIFREIIAADFPAMDGARDLIHSLAAAGIPMAIGSSGPPENVRLVVELLGVGDRLPSCVTGADVSRGKPDPQVFLLAAGRLRFPAERCVVIEDAPVGIQAARAAGMKCVGLASTGRKPAELQNANIVVQSLRELNPQRLGSLFEGKEDAADGH